MKLLFKSLLILILFLFTGCDSDSPVGIMISPPDCNLVSIEKYDGAFAVFAKDVLTVKNVDNSATAFNVGCTIDLMKGNTIVDRGSAYFGTLEPGISAVDKAYFTEIVTHAEYESTKITLFWNDANDGYYEKEFHR